MIYTVTMTLTVESFLTNAGKEACPEGAAFARQYQTMQEVWANCTNPGWMFWILERTRPLDGITQRRLACAFVRQPEVWKLLTDERSRNAVEVTEKFCDGQATSDELAYAANAANVAYAAANAANVAYAAANAAANAANAAANAANAAYAANAAANAAYAAYAAYADAYAYQCAEIRKRIPDIDVWIAGEKP